MYLCVYPPLQMKIPFSYPYGFKLFKFAIFNSLKLCIKYKLIDYIVNNIQLTQNLTYVLWVYRICNSTVRCSKYVVKFILLSKVIALDYNQFCS